MSKTKKTNMTFGMIKTVYNGMLAESISTGDKKKKGEFKKYLKLLKENGELKTQYYIHANIQNKFDENRGRAIDFIKENIKLMDTFTKKQITEANTKLAAGIVFEKKELYSVTDEVKELHENISYLINTKKGVSTVGGIVEATHKVADYIVNNKPSEVDPILEGLSDVVLSNKELGSLMVSKYNELYSTLKESEKATLKLVLESKAEGREELFKESIGECLTLVNTKLENADADLKMSLLSLKESLLNREYVKESFEVDILKVLELKGDLTGE